MRWIGSSALVIVAAAALSATVATSAQAVIFGFNQITTNATPSVGSQLSVDVTRTPAGDQVDVHVHNTGSIASSITDIYFDDGTLLGIASIDQRLRVFNVAFTEVATAPGQFGRWNIWAASDDSVLLRRTQTRPYIGKRCESWRDNYHYLQLSLYQWKDLRGHDRGAALGNVCKSGCTCKQSAGAGVIAS